MKVGVATFGDLLEHLSAQNRSLVGEHYRLIVTETVEGRVMAGTVDGRVAALGGIFDPGEGRHATCWLSIVAGAIRPQHMAPLALAMRGIVRWTAPRLPVPLAAYVMDGNAAGTRLAHALGFRPGETHVDGLRQWIFAGRSYGGRTDGQDSAEAVQPRS